MLIEQPIEAEWKLVAPEATEKTRALYRFAVTAEPGKPATLSVKEEKLINANLALTAFADEDDAALYLRAPVVSDAIRKAIVEVIRRKRAIAEVSAKRESLERKIAVVEEEQGRIRQNMVQLDKSSDLYKRYVKKFGIQEDEVEKLRPEVESLIAEAQKERAALDDYIESLNLN